jgi:Raf kinase inhibitor-like YbhB/YbcL family protein
LAGETPGKVFPPTCKTLPNYSFYRIWFRRNELKILALHLRFLNQKEFLLMARLTVARLTVARLTVALALLFCLGCSKSDSLKGGHPMTIQLSSPAFSEGSRIPTKFTADGDDHSPPLTWRNLPNGTQSEALICEDPDAPHGTYTHWVLFNLPPAAEKLEESIPSAGTRSDGSKQGKNDFGNLGYGGPAPPKGMPHRYLFKLYALDTMLSAQEGASKKEVLGEMKGHVLAEGQLMGTYER